MISILVRFEFNRNNSIYIMMEEGAGIIVMKDMATPH